MSYIDTLRIDDVDYDIRDKESIHKNEWLDIVYPIGTLYWNKTNPKNPREYLGGEWRQITDRVVVAAGSTFPIGSFGGSKDAVVVSHNHTQNSHNHTQNPHNHTQNSHGHSVTGHSHYPAKTYGRSYFVIAQGGNIIVSNDESNKLSGTGRKYPYVDMPVGRFDSSRGTSTEKEGINAARATNVQATAVNVPATATNNPAGESGINKNMPPYTTSYCWERIG